MSEAFDIIIRDATADDLPAINAIYNHYVLHCTCTWQTQIDTVEDRAKWFGAHGGEYPVIVAVCAGEVVGWGSLSKYRSREAWRPTTENSVYVRSDMQGKGIGKALLTELIVRAKASGFRSMVAVISGDQSASMRLHEKAGFVAVGRLREAGQKMGQYLDAVYMQKML